MLEQSILGKLYIVWLQSWFFSLLQRIYGCFRRAAADSLLLRLIFREGALEQTFHSSRIVSAVCAVFVRFRNLLARCDLLHLSDAWEDSAVIRLLRGSVLRWLTRFEGLFCAFLFVMFVVPHKHWNNLYAAAAAFLFLLLYLFLAGKGRRRWLSPKLLGLGGFLFLLALLLSLGFTLVPMDSLRILLFFLASFSLCYVIAANFRDPAKLRQLLAVLYAALLVISLYGIAQNVFDLVDVNSSYTDLANNQGVPGRVYSTLSNPINLSEFILLFMPLSAAFAGGAKKTWLQVLLALGLVFPALALLLTYSRGGWLAIVLAAVVFTFCCNKRLIPALILLGILAIPFLPDSVMTRLSTIGSTKDSSTMHRLDIWTGVLAMLRDDARFITGIGLGPETFSRVYPFYSVGTAKTGAYHSQLHYLELVLETGLLGLLSFLYMIFKYLGRASNGIRSGSRDIRLVLIACVSSIAALAFVGLVEYIWFYQRIMFAFFIFLGILLAAAGCAQDQAAAEEIQV